MKPYSLVTRKSQSRIDKYKNVDVREAKKREIRIIERETQGEWFV
jgi:hypothetical protein